jgi:hypothetical protein
MWVMQSLNLMLRPLQCSDIPHWMVLRERLLMEHMEYEQNRTICLSPDSSVS